MADDVTLARPYAVAAFERAKDTGTLEKWSEMLALLAAIGSDADMKALSASPKVPAEKLTALVNELGGEHFNAEGQNFVRLLVENGRLGVAAQIATTFEDLRARAEQRIEVRVISAYALGAKYKELIGQTMSQRLGREVNVTAEIDRALIAGVIIRAGDVVIDASARGRLAKFGQALLG
jgi:F-type H+-transporting ATPase subunit delta